MVLQAQVHLDSHMRDSQKYNAIINNVPIWFPCLREKPQRKFDETSHEFEKLFWVYDHAFSGSLHLQ